MKHNPDWDQRVFKRHCHGVAQYADQHDLPMPVTDNEELLFPGCDLGDYLGQGFYGVVYPTEKNGIVFKITSDESEAGFIQTAINLREKDVNPEGIVQYYAVAATHSKRRNKHVFVVWREEALGIGTEWGSQGNRFADLLDDVKTYAQGIRRLTAKKAKALGRAKEYWAWLKANLEPGRETALNTYLHQYRDHILQLVNESPMTNHVGHALEDYLYAGLVLADVHSGNVGRVRRGKGVLWAITDPGQATPLREDLSKPAIEVLQ